MAESEEAQICVLRNMFELWHYHQQMMIVLVDKMLKVQIVECSAVANWIFSKEMTAEFTKMYLWEILHLTIKKMNRHVIKLGGELADAREKLARAESSESESDEEDTKKKQPDTEKPTEEYVERMEEKLEAAQADQKNLFLIIFQRFIMILSEHLVRCDTDGKDYATHWYKWTIGRLQQVFLAVRFYYYFLTIPLPILYHIEYLNNAQKMFFVLASRTSSKIQLYIGNTTVHPGLGSAYSGGLPTIRVFKGLMLIYYSFYRNVHTLY